MPCAASKPTKPASADAPGAGRHVPCTPSTRKPPRMHRHQHPVEHLERALDAPADQQHGDAGQESADADQVDSVDIGRRRRRGAREQEEDRAGRGRRPRRPADLQEIEHGVEPRPERRARAACA